MRPVEELTKNYNATLWNIQHIVGTTYGGLIHLPDCGTCTVVFGYNEDGYEHVSISPKHINRMPSWDDMTVLKDIFFLPEEEAYQIMPKESEYVNIQKNCLHLWRPANGKRLDDLVRGKG